MPEKLHKCPLSFLRTMNSPYQYSSPLLPTSPSPKLSSIHLDLHFPYPRSPPLSLPVDTCSKSPRKPRQPFFLFHLLCQIRRFDLGLRYVEASRLLPSMSNKLRAYIWCVGLLWREVVGLVNKKTPFICGH